jgi:hypothetical protein
MTIKLVSYWPFKVSRTPCGKWGENGVKPATTGITKATASWEITAFIYINL